MASDKGTVMVLGLKKPFAARLHTVSKSQDGCYVTEDRRESTVTSGGAGGSQIPGKRAS